MADLLELKKELEKARKSRASSVLIAALEAAIQKEIADNPAAAVEAANAVFDRAKYLDHIHAARLLLEAACADAGLDPARVRVDADGVIGLASKNPRAVEFGPGDWGYKTHGAGPRKGETYAFCIEEDSVLLYKLEDKELVLKGKFTSLSAAAKAAGWANSGKNDIRSVDDASDKSPVRALIASAIRALEAKASNG